MRGAAPLRLLEDPAPAARARALPARDRIVIGPDHHGDVARRRPRAPLSTCASSVRPPIACSAFGRAERMRVPSPAASTIARHVRRCVFFRLMRCHRCGARARIGVHSGRVVAAYPFAPRNESQHCRILLTFSMT